MRTENKIWLGIALVAVGLMVGVFVAGNRVGNPASTPNADNEKLVRGNSHKQGAGKVTVVEFGDYQCPACGQAHPHLKQLQTAFPGKITFVFRNFPLPQHKNALISAEVAEAAGAQGKYWEMHDKLYENQEDWSELDNPLDVFMGYAKDLGLNIDDMKSAVDTKKFAGFINADKADGDALNLSGTPSIFVNGRQTDSFDYDTLKAATDEALKA